MSILDRITLSETWQMLIIGIAMVAGVFFATQEFAKIMSLICDLGLEPSTALLITALQLPGTIVWCLPAGVLLSTGIVLWRRIYDYETLTLHVNGASTARIMIPFVLMAFAASVLSLWLSDSIVPETKVVSNKLFLSGALNSNLPRSERCLTFFQYDMENSDQPLKQIMLAGRNLDKSLQNVIIFELAQNQAQKVIWAKTGEWTHGQWQLRDGHIYEIVSKNSGAMNMTFKKLGIDAIGKITDKFASRGPFSAELTIQQLGEMIESKKAKGEKVSNSLELRYQRRFSQPASCLLLVFAALPLCVATPRRRSFWGLAYIGIMVSVFFIAQQATTALGDNGALTPIAAAWLPGAIPVVIGCLTYALVRGRN
ncbi:LptF/LptG family permease [Candidatus Obscuribacterales bacterium]|nr:LptF/LptG family permease [Candidatus Obscuribacterales bacterium]MBX3136865.1 LptF/LptG family permease [Candidatus Obscuribacterales bacterium]